MFYHYLEYWQKTPDAMGCCRAHKIIGSTADNIDDAANERNKIAAQYHTDQIISISTHNVGMGPAVSQGTEQ